MERAQQNISSSYDGGVRADFKRKLTPPFPTRLCCSTQSYKLHTFKLLKSIISSTSVAEVFDTTFFDTDTILIPCRYGYSIPIRYWYFSVIKFRYRYWYWYFSAIKFRYRYWYWYFHQMNWYPIWYQNLLEIAIFLPKNQWNQSF